MSVITPIVYLVAIPAATAQPSVPNGCINQSYYDAVQIGVPKYEVVGTAAGKYNASSSAGTLTYALSVSIGKSTTVSSGVSGGVDWGIAQVDATTSFTLTKTVSAGVTVTDGLTVPAHMYGYDQPKIERRTFEIDRYATGSNCVQTKTFIGYVYGITAWPFFSSCVSTSACTPQP